MRNYTQEKEHRGQFQPQGVPLSASKHTRGIDQIINKDLNDLNTAIHRKTIGHHDFLQDFVGERRFFGENNQFAHLEEMIGSRSPSWKVHYEYKKRVPPRSNIRTAITVVERSTKLPKAYGTYTAEGGSSGERGDSTVQMNNSSRTPVNRVMGPYEQQQFSFRSHFSMQQNEDPQFTQRGISTRTPIARSNKNKYNFRILNDPQPSSKKGAMFPKVQRLHLHIRTENGPMQPKNTSLNSTKLSLSNVSGTGQVSKDQQFKVKQTVRRVFQNEVMYPKSKQVSDSHQINAFDTNDGEEHKTLGTRSGTIQNTPSDIMNVAIVSKLMENGKPIEAKKRSDPERSPQPELKILPKGRFTNKTTQGEMKVLAGSHEHVQSPSEEESRMQPAIDEEANSKIDFAPREHIYKKVPIKLIGTGGSRSPRQTIQAQVNLFSPTNGGYTRGRQIVGGTLERLNNNEPKSYNHTVSETDRSSQQSPYSTDVPPTAAKHGDTSNHTPIPSKVQQASPFTSIKLDPLKKLNIKKRFQSVGGQKFDSRVQGIRGNPNKEWMSATTKDGRKITQSLIRPVVLKNLEFQQNFQFFDKFMYFEMIGKGMQEGTIFDQESKSIIKKPIFSVPRKALRGRSHRKTGILISKLGFHKANQLSPRFGFGSEDTRELEEAGSTQKVTPDMPGSSTVEKWRQDHQFPRGLKSAQAEPSTFAVAVKEATQTNKVNSRSITTPNRTLEEGEEKSSKNGAMSPLKKQNIVLRNKLKTQNNPTRKHQINCINIPQDDNLFFATLSAEPDSNPQRRREAHSKLKKEIIQTLGSQEMLSYRENQSDYRGGGDMNSTRKREGGADSKLNSSRQQRVSPKIINKYVAQKRTSHHVQDLGSSIAFENRTGSAAGTQGTVAEYSMGKSSKNQTAIEILKLKEELNIGRNHPGRNQSNLQRGDSNSILVNEEFLSSSKSKEVLQSVEIKEVKMKNLNTGKETLNSGRSNPSPVSGAHKKVTILNNISKKSILVNKSRNLEPGAKTGRINEAPLPKQATYDVDRSKSYSPEREPTLLGAGFTLGSMTNQIRFGGGAADGYKQKPGKSSSRVANIVLLQNTTGQQRQVQYDLGDFKMVSLQESPSLSLSEEETTRRPTILRNDFKVTPEMISLLNKKPAGASGSGKKKAWRFMIQ